MNAKFLIKFFLLFILSIAFLGCRLGIIKECHDFYSFKVDIEVELTSDVYSMGDTLRISMTTDNTDLYDQQAFRTVEVPNFNPLHRILLPRLDTFPIQHDGLQLNQIIVPTEYDFEFRDLESESKFSALVIDTIESRPDSSFMEIKVVFKEPGTYALMSFLAMAHFHSYDSTTEVSDRCNESINLSATPFFYENRFHNQHILTENQNIILDSIYEVSNNSYYFFNVLE